MNIFKRIVYKPYLMLLPLMAMGTACEKDETAVVVLFEPGTVDGAANSTAIKAGESVTYTDNSTKVQSRVWTFPGGTPSTSTDQEVTVVYNSGGSFVTKLEAMFVDNTSLTDEITVEVEAPPLPPAPVIVGPTYGVYTENPNITPGAPIKTLSNNLFTIATTFEAPYDGTEAQAYTTDQSKDWAMLSILPESGMIDATEFADGFYNVSLKSTSNGSIRIRMKGNNQVAFVTLTAAGEEYGFVRDGEWHLLHIPMADFKANNAAVDFSAITDIFVIRSSSDPREANNFDFYMDNLYLSINKPE